MAKRRCVSVDIFEMDNFLDMTDKSKVLYMAFILHCDDDGVIINPRTVMRLNCAYDTNLDELIENGFVLCADGLYIITHWLLHNKISPSKKTDSIYKERMSKVCVDALGRYFLREENAPVCDGKTGEVYAQ